MKKGFRYALEWILTCLGFFAAFVVLIIARTIIGDYRVATVDTARSRDGAYSVTLQEIEDPMALRLYGPAFRHLVLTRDGAAVSELDISVANDGLSLSPDTWEVSWADSETPAVHCLRKTDFGKRRGII